jgi:hypothetical protein
MGGSCGEAQRLSAELAASKDENVRLSSSLATSDATAERLSAELATDKEEIEYLSSSLQESAAANEHMSAVVYSSLSDVIDLSSSQAASEAEAKRSASLLADKAAPGMHPPPFPRHVITHALMLSASSVCVCV